MVLGDDPPSSLAGIRDPPERRLTTPANDDNAASSALKPMKNTHSHTASPATEGAGALSQKPSCASNSSAIEAINTARR